MNLDPEDRVLNIVTKSILKEDLSENEIKDFHLYDAKYKLVVYLIMEKFGMSDFHFSPGIDFINIPTIDIVNEFVKIYEGIQGGSVETTTLDFGDVSPFSKAPETGKLKRI